MQVSIVITLIKGSVMVTASGKEVSLLLSMTLNAFSCRSSSLSFLFFIRTLSQPWLWFYLFFSHMVLSWLYPTSHMITVEIGSGPLLTLKEMDGYCCALRDNDCKNAGRQRGSSCTNINKNWTGNSCAFAWWITGFLERGYNNLHAKLLNSDGS